MRKDKRIPALPVFDLCEGNTPYDLQDNSCVALCLYCREELKAQRIKDQEFLDTFKELCDSVIKKQREEKSIAELLAKERLQKANQALNKSQSPQEMRIQDLEIQKQQCLEEMKEWMNDLGIREYRKEEIDIDYRRKCEDKIYELKDKFNGLSIEIRKIIQEAEELRESEARART
ncbi:hypothetical protein Tco_1576673 [Tanacetum coccineum]